MNLRQKNAFWNSVSFYKPGDKIMYLHKKFFLRHGFDLVYLFLLTKYPLDKDMCVSCFVGKSKYKSSTCLTLTKTETFLFPYKQYTYAS